MKILKAILLLSAGITVALRLFSYENQAFLPDKSVEIMNIISFTAAGICIVSALIWVFILKREEKKKREENREE